MNLLGFRLFSDINFYIIGSGDNLFFLKEKAGKNVNFLGQVNHYDLSDKIKDMDLCFYHQSLRGFQK